MVTMEGSGFAFIDEKREEEKRGGDQAEDGGVNAGRGG